jgi:hypothetical protein
MFGFMVLRALGSSGGAAKPKSKAERQRADDKKWPHNGTLGIFCTSPSEVRRLRADTDAKVAALRVAQAAQWREIRAKRAAHAARDAAHAASLAAIRTAHAASLAAMRAGRV